MDKSEHLNLYREMVVIRRLEERAAELYQQGKIGGFLHLYIGQEAVSTGLIAARQPQDRVITAYRDHGVAINCGISADQVMAELLGKSTGVSKGKAGRCTWRMWERTSSAGTLSLARTFRWRPAWPWGINTRQRGSDHLHVR